MNRANDLALIAMKMLLQHKGVLSFVIDDPQSGVNAELGHPLHVQTEEK
ncbi:MAG TPA: hypothetical protein VLH56_15585 [Dissulfurispiraceae bacterium]|nr:hypothetical protein [Dissulfurispiraceae bacterium]